MNEPILIHATAVAIEGAAVLLRGPPGAGKSDLALRLIDTGAVLVADDQVELRRSGDAVLARAPASIAGLIEVRGVGIIRMEPVGEAPLSLIADLVPAAEVERLPECRTEDILGLRIPLLALAPFEASAPVKVRLACRGLARLC